MAGARGTARACERLLETRCRPLVEFGAAGIAGLLSARS